MAVFTHRINAMQVLIIHFFNQVSFFFDSCSIVLHLFLLRIFNLDFSERIF